VTDLGARAPRERFSRSLPAVGLQEGHMEARPVGSVDVFACDLCSVGRERNFWVD
jgi:hypothetical protein